MIASVRADVESVKAAVAPDGCVWYLDGDTLPRQTKMSASEFVKSPPFSEPRNFRVPGGLRNARLILSLYADVVKKKQLSLQICSPAACGATNNAEISEVLFNARGCNLPVSVGGWHTCDSDAAISHALAVRTSGQIVWDELEILSLLGKHPAAKAASFIEDVDPTSLAYVLGQVIDPRWYLDPTDPDFTTNKLAQFLGLDPKCQVEEPVTTDRAKRYNAVLRCWKTGKVPSLNELRPGQFVWRTWYGKGGGAKGDLSACKRIIEYLRQTWTAALCKSGQGPRLFLPQYFFLDPGESLGYQEHMNPTKN